MCRDGLGPIDVYASPPTLLLERVPCQEPPLSATLASRCSHVTGTHQENVKGSDVYVLLVEEVYMSSLPSFALLPGYSEL